MRVIRQRRGAVSAVVLDVPVFDVLVIDILMIDILLIGAENGQTTVIGKRRSPGR